MFFFSIVYISNGNSSPCGCVCVCICVDTRYIHIYARGHDAKVGGFPSHARLLRFFSPPNCIGCLNQRVSYGARKSKVNEKERRGVGEEGGTPPHEEPPFCISKAQFKKYVKSSPLCSMYLSALGSRQT